MQKTNEYLLTINKAILALAWNISGTECCLEPQSVMPSENRLNIWLEIKDYFASLIYLQKKQLLVFDVHVSCINPRR